jgi:hypothetical protein
MKGIEFKKMFIGAKELNKVAVVGHLTEVAEGQKDSYFYIEDNEEIPYNVGLSFHIHPKYQDHWRDNTPIQAPILTCMSAQDIGG